LRQLYEKFNVEDKMIVDGVDYMHSYISDPTKRVIAEGANATMLDIDFGTYPYVTSSNTTIGGVCTGLGVPPQVVETTIGIVKAYTTRVGAGPFPTWLDLNVVAYSHRLNGFQSLNITKLDVLTGIKNLKVCTHYELDGRILKGSMPS